MALTKNEKVVVTVGSVLAGAIGAGLAALFTRGKKTATGPQAGARPKGKGCGGCGR
jgi:hypothetical protein